MYYPPHPTTGRIPLAGAFAAAKSADNEAGATAAAKAPTKILHASVLQKNPGGGTREPARDRMHGQEGDVTPRATQLSWLRLFAYCLKRWQRSSPEEQLRRRGRWGAVWWCSQNNNREQLQKKARENSTTAKTQNSQLSNWMHNCKINSTTASTGRV